MASIPTARLWGVPRKKVMVTPYEDSAMQAIARLGLSAATRYATPMLMQKDTSVVTQISTTLPCGRGAARAYD